MGFVKLRDLYGKEIKIPSSAVSTYKNLGFYPLEEVKGNKPQTTKGKASKKVEVTAEEDEFVVPEGSSEKTEDEIFAEAVVKKPLASWSKDEVKRYAGIFGIDLSGTKSANDAKERIKEFMSEAE